jgi:hypothetical protein
MVITALALLAVPVLLFVGAYLLELLMALFWPEE